MRHGAFTAASTTGTDDLTYLAAALITRPFSRDVLVDPDARRLALCGQWNPEAGVAGVLVSTYALFDGMSATDLARAAWSDLNAQRERRGQRQAQRWGLHRDVRQQMAEAVIAGDLSPEQALQTLVDAYAAEASGPVRAFQMELNRMEDLRWPDAMLDVRGLTLDVVGAYRQVEGEPWRRFVVFVLEQVRPQTTQR